jgi:hypothetical protein
LSFLGDFYKNRSNGDSSCIADGNLTVHRHHSVPPLSQLKEMLTTSTSDAEHSSIDNHDAKDLSFRTNLPQQAPVITSTAATQSENHTMDTDYENVRSPSIANTTLITAAITKHNANNSIGNISPVQQNHESVLRTTRVRKLSETSTDVEHSNNYKFKNYIQQRFTHENYHSEESMQSSLCVTETDKDHDKRGTSPMVAASVISDECNAKANDTDHEIKSETINSSPKMHQTPITFNQRSSNNSRVNNSFVLNSHQSMIHLQSIPIPIFACHTQGFYVPLSVDYELLIPFLGGIDLLSKNFSHLPPLHPISINVSYTPPTTPSKNAITTTHFIKPKVEGMVNGW